MKNLKMFAISLVAFAAMTMGVHATGADGCTLPTEDGYKTAGANKCVVTYNNASYKDIKAAWDAAVAGEGGEITLLDDATGSLGFYGNVEKNITLNVGSHKLTLTSSGIVVKSGKTLKITGTGDVNINSEVTVAITVEDGATLTTEGALLLGSTNTAALISTAGTVNIGTGAELRSGGAIIRITAPTANVTLNANVGKDDAAFAGKLIDLGSYTAPDRGEARPTITITGGSYYTSDRVLDIDKNVKVLVSDGTFVSKTAATVHVAAGDVTLENGTYKAEGKGMTVVATTGEVAGTLTINGGTYTSDLFNAVWLSSGKVVTKITNGTFNGGKVDGKRVAAIYILDSKLTGLEEDGDDDIFKGMLTGGKYLDTIIGKAELNGKTYSADTVQNYVVAAGKTVTEEGNYKVIGGSNDDQNTGDANTPEEQNPNVPSNPPTNDNILVYAGLGLISAATIGFTTRRKENN